MCERQSIAYHMRGVVGLTRVTRLTIRVALIARALSR